MMMSTVQAMNVNVITANAIRKQRELQKQLFEVYVSAFETVYKDTWTQESKDYFLHLFDEYMDQLQKDDRMILMDVMENDTLLGWTLFKRDNNSAIVELLCVDPMHWRRGIGKKIILAIRETFPDITHMALVSYKLNPISHSFYPALGFKKTDFQQPQYKAEDMQGYEWHKE